MVTAGIPLSEYSARRKKLRTALKKSVAVIHAGDLADALHDDFHANSHFEYLTGISDEPGAVLVLAPGEKNPRRQEMLFLKATDPELERWEGIRARLGTAYRKEIGITSIARLYHLPRFLTAVAQNAKSLACVHPFASFEASVSPDLALFRKIAERIPGTAIEDCTEAVPRLRATKSKNEVAVLQQAVNITALGFEEVFKVLEPGLNEFAVQEALEHTYRMNGSRGTGYGTIAGGGINSTIAHYRANNAPLEDGDLICIDSGARYRAYTADVTRTLPVNGRFTKRQREIYELVLKAQVAAVKAVKPGATLTTIEDAARKIISKAGYGDAFHHSIGHHLGIDVHDPAPGGALRVGAVVTVEPGIYLPDEKIGIRIEDDILVTKNGHRNLSVRIPKTVAEIQRRMR